MNSLIIRLPELNIDLGKCGVEGVESETVTMFADIYRQHLTQLMEAVVNLNFASIQHIWMRFWSMTESEHNDNQQQQIPKSKMKILLTIPELQTFIQVSLIFIKNILTSTKIF